MHYLPTLARRCWRVLSMAAVNALTAPKVMRLRLLLVHVLLAAVPMATARQDASGATHEKAAGFEPSLESTSSFESTILFDAAPPAVNVSTSRAMRRLAVINVQAGVDTLQAALNAANYGDELVLANGTYTGSGTNVLDVGKSITIRALHARGAILDGQSARRVVYVTSGTVVFEGLDITGGYVASVRARPEFFF